MKQTEQPTAILPTRYGNFRITVYSYADKEHAVLTMGDISQQPTLIRIHSQCITGDTFGSMRCDCQEQLHMSFKKISEKGSGIILYLNQEGRGIGLSNKIRAYALQEEGLDTVEANEALHLPVDARDFSVAADILRTLDITQVSLMTNNPEKVTQLQKYGITVSEQIPLLTVPNKHNKKYIQTKKKKLGHLFS